MLINVKLSLVVGIFFNIYEQYKFHLGKGFTKLKQDIHININCSIRITSSCADPISFVRGGPTQRLVDKERTEDLYNT